MANIRNTGTVIGRLTRDVTVFTNSDGSRKVMVNLAVQRNFTNANGEKESDMLQFDGFVPNSKPNLGVYDYMHKGDLVGITYSLRSNNYEKDGQMVYAPQIAFIENVDLMESKSVTNARAAKNNSQPAQPANASAQAPAQPAEEAPATDTAEADLPFSE